MAQLVRPVLAAFEVANFNVGLQLSDMKNVDAVRRARDDEGASISWNVGHMLNSRCLCLSACGVELENPYEGQFSFRSPATDGADYPDITELRDAWQALHTLLRETLTDLDDAALLADSPLPNPMGDSSLLGGLAFFAWHEAYHAGSMGSLRVQWGYRHTHELALEVIQARAKAQD